MALNPQAAYVGTLGVRPQGRPARQRDRQAARRVRARRAGLRRQRHPLRDVGAGGQVDDRAEGPGARHRARRPDDQRGRRHAQAPRARGLPLRGRRRVARAAHAPGVRLGAGLLPGRELPGDHRRPRRPTEHARRRHDRGDDQGARRRRAADRDRRGQRSGQRARPGAARRARRPLPGARPRPPHRLQGAGARHPARAPARSPGCCSTRTDGEESLDHDRGQREHHRGQLAGPVRLARLRLAPSLVRG